MSNRIAEPGPLDRGVVRSVCGQAWSTGSRQATVALAALILAAALCLTLALIFAPRADAYIYWTQSAGYIERANLDGSPSVAPRAYGDDTLLTTAPYPGTSGALPTGVKVDGAHIYWANNGLDSGTTIGRANLDGTGVQHDFITGASGPADVAVDANHVYWTNLGADTIGRANLDGTGVDQSFISLAEWGGSEVTSPGGIAVDGAHIYWGNFGFYGRTIGRANLDGTGVDPNFIGAANDPRGVVVDEAHIYWANAGAGTIGRADVDGTGVEQSFIGGATFPQGVAVYGGYIYWTTEDPDVEDDVVEGGIGRAKLDGTDVDQTFIAPADAQGVAVDALRSFEFGSVKKNKKKGTAKLTVKVAGPGTLKLAKTESVKGARTFTDVQGKAKLPVRPSREAKKRLKRKGKAKVKATVTYTPHGAGPNVVGNTNATTLRLAKRR